MAAPRRVPIEVETTGDMTVVRFALHTSLDEQNAQTIGDQLISLAEQIGGRKLLLEFGNVEYITSTALGKLITLSKKLTAAGGQLVLAHLNPRIAEVFEITRLNQLFTIVRDRNDEGPDGGVGGVRSPSNPPRP